jgi:hypothetical protein
MNDYVNDDNDDATVVRDPSVVPANVVVIMASVADASSMQSVALHVIIMMLR